MKLAFQVWPSQMLGSPHPVEPAPAPLAPTQRLGGSWATQQMAGAQGVPEAEFPATRGYSGQARSFSLRKAGATSRGY